jgi:uncharacterized protein (TIGR03435 family)
LLPIGGLPNASKRPMKLRHYFCPAVIATLLYAQSPGPLLEFSVTPASHRKKNLEGTFSKFVGEGLTLRRTLGLAYVLPELRVLGPAFLDEDAFNLVMRFDTKASQDAILTAFQQVLLDHFHVTVARRDEAMPIYVLRQVSGAKPTIKSSNQSKSRITVHDGRDVDATGATIKQLMARLEPYSDRPIFDETGITGTYDVKMTIDESDLGSIVKSVRDQLSLELVSENRSIPVIVVAKK